VLVKFFYSKPGVTAGFCFGKCLENPINFFALLQGLKSLTKTVFAPETDGEQCEKGRIIPLLFFKINGRKAQRI
tara:strand:- start:28 stop:249 length:222 start_codon:yes stop_codon:yes gene_type:complete